MENQAVEQPVTEPHERLITGFVARKREDKGYGFVRDGTPRQPGLREWYFHSRDLIGTTFVSLRIGDEMEFVPYEPVPVEGPRAVKVKRR